MWLTDDNEEKVDEVLGRTDQVCVTVCAQVQKHLKASKANFSAPSASAKKMC